MACAGCGKRKAAARSSRAISRSSRATTKTITSRPSAIRQAATRATTRVNDKVGNVTNLEGKDFSYYYYIGDDNVVISKVPGLRYTGLSHGKRMLVHTLDIADSNGLWSKHPLEENVVANEEPDVVVSDGPLEPELNVQMV